MLFEYLEFSTNVHRMILAHSECIGSRMQFECSSNSVGIFRMLSKCSECKSNAIRLQFECCPNNARSASNAVWMQTECSRNGYRIRFERPRNARIQTKCSWNTNVLLMYLDCNTSVKSRPISRIRPDYFPIAYKMLQNLAFSSVSTQPL